MPKTKHEKVAIYGWSGNGNLGDDWLLDIGKSSMSQFAPVSLKERRNISPRRDVSKRYGLRRSCGRAVNPSLPMVLWGGGWLAGDQSPEVLLRWRHHVGVREGPVFGFGLGIGPFWNGTSDIGADLLQKFASPVYVRTRIDLAALAELGLSGKLACDPALLAGTVSPRAARPSSASTRDHVVVSVPRYHSHWGTFANESDYRDFVVDNVARIAAGRAVVFLDMDHPRRGTGDGRYWRRAFPSQLIPNAWDQAAALISGAAAVVAGRLHAGIMAAQLGVPVIALPYHHKFDALDEIGVPMLSPGERNSTKPAVADRGGMRFVAERGAECLTELITRLSSQMARRSK